MRVWEVWWDGLGGAAARGLVGREIGVVQNSTLSSVVVHEAGVAKLRPLQLWLKMKPKGMTKAERLQSFKDMSESVRNEFVQSTRAERGVA